MRTITIKELERRVRGDIYRFKLTLDEVGTMKVAITGPKGPLRFDALEGEETIAKHLRETVSEFVTGFAR